VLREVARESRRSTRDPNATQYATEEDIAPLQATLVTLQGQLTALQSVAPLGHDLLVSDGSGLLTFTYPMPNPHPAPAVPVIQATPVANDNALVTVFTVTATSAVLGVRRADTGAAFPGISVFVTAFPSTIVP
jgi:hypothetical protein